MCKCNTKLNFVEDAKGNCVCKKHYVLSNDSERCVSDGSGAGPGGFLVLTPLLFVLAAVLLATVVVVRKKQRQTRLLGEERREM